jgi:hypothetical protein
MNNNDVMIRIVLTLNRDCTFTNAVEKHPDVDKNIAAVMVDGLLSQVKKQQTWMAIKHWEKKVDQE